MKKFVADKQTCGKKTESFVIDMIVWTVANQKGGVGKTTSAVTMAGILAAEGKRVLLLDTDPHASLTACFGYDSDELDHTMLDLFTNNDYSYDTVKASVISTGEDNISIIGGSIALATLDKTLNRDGVGLILKKSLQLLSGDFDVAIIDCPPVLGVMMVNALAASSMIIVPTQTEFLALKGLERMMKTFEILKGTKAEEMNYMIVPTMYDRRTKASNQSLESIRQSYGANVWNGVIPIDTRFRDASERHRPASMLYPHSRGVEAYRMLTSELLNRDGNIL